MGDPKAAAGPSAPSRDRLTNDTFVAFADLDASPTKAWLVENRQTKEKFFDLAFAKRPREELYVLASDRDQIDNVADKPRFAAIKQSLNQRLMNELARLGDPRVVDGGIHFERPPFAGEQNSR